MLPLQPWLTMCRVAEGLARRGHSVHVVSDVAEPAELDGVESHSVASLRGSNAAEMLALLTSLAPDALVFMPTPLNIATASWLDGLDCRCVGFASYPFYNSRELMTAIRCIGWPDVKQYLRHLLVPGPVWKRALRRRMHALIAQSVTTNDRLCHILGDKSRGRYIPPGIELADWPLIPETDAVEATGSDGVKLLYLGAALAIRGFYIVLDALARIQDQSVSLRVLARNADSEDVKRIRAAVERRGLAGRVEIEGGWIDRQQLIDEIKTADAVLQPFVLVPSELPVTAMEVIACGTPVIGSAIDGLPSTIGPAGCTVAQGDSAMLAETVIRFVREAQLRNEWRAGCLQQRDAMLDWDSVTEKWEAVLSE